MKSMTPKEVHEAQTSDGPIYLVDVRTPEEFEEVRASYAKNLPLDQLNEAKFRSLLGDNYKGTQTVYMICRSGGRSAKACELLESDGITNLVNVTGGTLEWVARDLPHDKAK